MRLKSGIWVAAYLRRCDVEGVFAAVRRRGAEEAGTIFIKVNRLDGTGTLYGPAPQDGTTIALIHSSVPLAPLFGTGTINQNDFSLAGLGVSLLGAIILLAIVNLFRRGRVR